MLSRGALPIAFRNKTLVWVSACQVWLESMRKLNSWCEYTRRSGKQPTSCQTIHYALGRIDLVTVSPVCLRCVGGCRPPGTPGLACAQYCTTYCVTVKPCRGLV